MITPEFRREVKRLREEGWTWGEVAELTGRAKRTCQRAVGAPAKSERCCERGCQEPVGSPSSKYCVAHGRIRQSQANRGRGEQQRKVLKIVRQRGLVTNQQVQDATGMSPAGTHQVLSRLTKIGLLERPVYGHYRLPVHNQDS